MALKPTHRWGTTEGQFQSRLQKPKRANCNKTNRQTITIEHANKKSVNKQEASMNQWTNNVTKEQYCPYSLQRTLHIREKKWKEMYCNRPITIHFHPIFVFIYNVVYSEYGQYCSSMALLVHWLMLSHCLFTSVLFSCCCCSCFPYALVAICMLGILQPRLELPFCRSPLAGGFGCRV